MKIQLTNIVLYDLMSRMEVHLRTHYSRTWSPIYATRSWLKPDDQVIFSREGVLGKPQLVRAGPGDKRITVTDPSLGIIMRVWKQVRPLMRFRAGMEMAFPLHVNEISTSRLGHLILSVYSGTAVTRYTWYLSKQSITFLFMFSRYHVYRILQLSNYAASFYYHKVVLVQVIREINLYF